MKLKLFTLGLAIVLTAVSCTKDKDDTSNITADEAAVNAKIDVASDDVSQLIEDQYDATMVNTANKTTPSLENNTLPPCATVTRVPAFGTPITAGTTVTKTVDFGTTGCAINNGNILKGKIIMTFVYQPTATTHTVTYTFENFYHNDNMLSGSKTFTRSLTPATATSLPHPIVTMNMDLTLTRPNGTTFTRVGQRVREIVEGYSTPSWTDNIYKVTGAWTTTFPNTTVQTSTITTPLMIKMSCVAVNKPLIVKGVITFVRNDHTATLDYGTGECDNTAIFTSNGVSTVITIGN
ncbi:hypothetical protein B0A58_11640 [Flavobacterium branchiophilum NBRC 15030 = ATCC 35035]|uniref:Lipoprotein n=1 Tax=Flavobacterium branchiophilum TaxID=55197 RepID=A0A543G5U0_9FLAO|nr:hypothetical protein [Flavobacterium branchiophilum]OXA73569.1 hypothetical protein B0A58_11640 [Flavobacterium branchiophilum NBRC 15030 = ATCC 35035]TQM41450.1 hypothetical protein BC670_2415 [Flavobacterium branchiophilum]GEM55338.1 hypothetical protein FB1_15590 [Flavobacterium branchiophilum NBRC 15030 = ATCC 35035]